MLDRIDWVHFGIETKHLISQYPEYFGMLNPHTSGFFKCHGIYLSIIKEDYKAIIQFAIRGHKSEGNKNWVQEVLKALKYSGFHTVEFQTSVKNSAVNKIAEKIQAKHVDTVKEFYADGSDCLIYHKDISGDL